MTDQTPVVLSTAYFAPIQYFTKFLLSPVLIEKHENYDKQSFRNRCVIYGANGTQTLVVPVKKNHGQKTRITDVLIDYDTDWQKLHQRGIESAYRSAPFFEFYYDDFLPYFEKKHKYLFDLNNEITETICGNIEIDADLSFTENFFEKNEEENDFRNSIHPKKRMKKKDFFFSPKEYNQVFSDKYGFIPNLSILDLIFNQGPEAIKTLRESIVNQHDV